MVQSELFRHVIRVLEQLGLRYFVTGSTASIYHGEPRLTNDIDIVVELPTDRVTEFCSAFPASDYYVSEAAAREAVAGADQFNIIRPDSGLKVDVMLPADSPFDRARFGRARRVTVPGGVQQFSRHPKT